VTSDVSLGLRSHFSDTPIRREADAVSVGVVGKDNRDELERRLRREVL
jgi:hypothetical protein